MDPKNKDFKSLQAKWDQKLADSGFEDAEKDGYLKVWSSYIFTTRLNGSYYNEKQSYYKAKEEYFTMATHFLHDYNFENEFDRYIWSLHSEGLSLTEIVDKLKSKEKNWRFKKTSVYNAIARLAKVMVKAQNE